MADLNAGFFSLRVEGVVVSDDGSGVLLVLLLPPPPPHLDGYVYVYRRWRVV